MADPKSHTRRSKYPSLLEESGHGREVALANAAGYMLARGRMKEKLGEVGKDDLPSHKGRVDYIEAGRKLLATLDDIQHRRIEREARRRIAEAMEREEKRRARDQSGAVHGSTELEVPFKPGASH